MKATLFRLRPEAWIALSYLAFGALWILFSDRFVESLAFSPETLTRLQTYKGWLFVSASALFIFGLLRAAFQKERETQETLRRQQAELEQTERQYRLLFESNPLPMWIYDPESLRFLAVNRAALEKYGYSLEEFRAMRITDIRPAEEVPRLLETITTPRSRYRRSGPWKHKRKDGTLIQVEIFAHEIEYFGRPARLVLANDITERIRAEEMLRLVSLRLAEVQESERLTLSKELHDQVGQSLTALGINLNLIQAGLGGDVSPAVQARFASASELLQEITDKIRDVMGELHPPVLQSYGLAAALRWLAERIRKQTGLEVEAAGEIIEPRLPLVTAASLFRIAREALNNVIKHAQATRAWLRLESTPQQVILTIEDNGKGFDPQAIADDGQIHWGLTTMRERVNLLRGSFQVESTPGRGTKVVICVPRGNDEQHPHLAGR